MVRELIVNADEFGLTEGVNRGIEAVHRRGLCTSTTLVANEHAFENAIEMARQMPGLAIGVHLNITHGVPVLPEVRVHTLVDEDGLFYRRSRFLRRAVAGQVNLVHVEDEFRAQIEKVMEAGILPSHLDSHESIYMYPAIFRILASLAREYHLPARLQDEHLMRAGFASRELQARYLASETFAKNQVMNVLANRYRILLRDWGIPTTDHFISTFGCYRKQPNDLYEALRYELVHLPEGVTELMVHPGFADSLLEMSLDGGREAALRREEEVHVLTDPRIRALLEEQQIRLIDYRVLGAIIA
ncbi:MAG: ChbG/HpnK family deacetylase [Chloroflexi bacterium]|nr:ChbG/HpnK family deacetylase [Chloroflexota bacterium]